MNTHGRPRNLWFHDFPGVFAAKVFLALVAIFWPWYLHGVARVAVGIPWTGCALVIAFLIARKWMAGQKR